MILSDSRKFSGLSTLRFCLAAALVFGLGAHAAGMFSGISYHDDVVCTYDVGATHIVGRFTLALLGKLTRLPFGGNNYSLPWFNGLLSILFIGLTAWVMIRSLQITHRLLQLLLSGILVTFPVVTGTFAYWFTAPYYMLALLLACISASLLTGELLPGRPLAALPAGAVLAALMIGIYQAYLPVMLTLELLILLRKESAQQGSFRGWILPAGGTGAGILLYLLLMRVSLGLTGKELYAYRGMDTLGAGNFRYSERIAMAYRMFFNPDSFLPYRGSDDYQLFMWSMRPVYTGLMLLLLIAGIALLILTLCTLRSKGRREGCARLFRTAFLLLLFPLTENFIFVMTDYDVYDLMLYGEVMVFVLGLWFAQQFLNRGPGGKAISGFLCLLVFYAVLFYLRYDNLCYYKAGRMQEAAVSYDNVLIARIQALDAYDPSLPVCFLHEFEKDTSFLAADPELEKVRITPYDGTEIINDYSWVSFMKVHCGYNPTVIEDYGQYDSYVAQTQMPRYPAADSIRIIDGVIVVNF